MSGSRDDYDDYDEREPAGDWTPGMCDRCGMKTSSPESQGPFMPVCACSVGEGAPAHECMCT